MNVRLNITMDAALYRRLKRELPPKGISAFIEAAVKGRLRPGRAELEAAYVAASRESWRRELVDDWSATEVEGWPRGGRRGAYTDDGKSGGSRSIRAAERRAERRGRPSSCRTTPVMPAARASWCCRSRAT